MSSGYILNLKCGQTLQQPCAGIFQLAEKLDSALKGWLSLLLFSYKQGHNLWRAAAPQTRRQKRIRRVYTNSKWRKNLISELYLSVLPAHCSWLMFSCWSHLWGWPDPALGLGAPSKFGKCQRWECRKAVKNTFLCITNFYQLQQS